MGAWAGGFPRPAPGGNGAPSQLEGQSCCVRGEGVGWEPAECNEATKRRRNLGLAVLAVIPVTFTHYSKLYALLCSSNAPQFSSMLFCFYVILLGLAIIR